MIKISRLSDWPIYRGRPVQRWFVANAQGMSFEVLSLGGIIRCLIHPDGTDIILGCDSLADYLAQTAYLGALIGRCANRIAFGRARIGEKLYQLPINNPPHHLHGGTDGFDRRNFDVEPLSDGLRLQLHSPDHDQGYPGEVNICIEYRLNESNILSIDMLGEGNAPTLLNLTQHTYFSLAGGDCIHHRLYLESKAYLPVRSDLIPTGDIKIVDGTPFDFRSPQSLAMGIAEEPGRNHPQIVMAKGYDHCFVLDNKGKLSPAARLSDPVSGRQLQIATNQPGIQIYSGNYLAGTPGKGKKPYGNHAGIALECQYWPDAINQQNFPKPLLAPPQKYHHQTLWELR